MGDGPFSNALKALESHKIPADRVSAHYGFLSLAADGAGLTYYLERHGKPRFRAELRRVH